MKVNNITRLIVACLWCCSILVAAKNPHSEKPIDNTQSVELKQAQAEKAEAYKARQDAFKQMRADKRAIGAPKSLGDLEAQIKTLEGLILRTPQSMDDRSMHRSKKAFQIKKMEKYYSKRTNETAVPFYQDAPGNRDCVDTDNGATDPYGDGCAAYNNFPSWCGNYDDDDFQSNDMCCICGGGADDSAGDDGAGDDGGADCIDTNFDADGNEITDGWDGCSTYIEAWCGNYDTADFISGDMCCICGGGDSMRAAC